MQLEEEILASQHCIDLAKKYFKEGKNRNADYCLYHLQCFLNGQRHPVGFFAAHSLYYLCRN